MDERRRLAGGRPRAHPWLTAAGLAAGAAVLGGAALPLGLALTDVHLSGAPLALAVSTGAAALAVPALALQPLLAATGRIRRHRALGAAALALVLVHIGALFLVGVDDTLFAMSPDGPTRARMALIATLALVAAVFLGATRHRLPISDASWRILHAYLAALVIVLGVGHAVLTDGALDGAGTAVLLALGTIGLAGVPVAHAARTRRRRR